MGSVGMRTYQFHLARINRRERPPNRRDNHFPFSRPHTNIATTLRRPYPISWNWRLDARRILVDPGSSTDLLQALVIKQMGLEPSSLENPGRILSGFNGVATTSIGDVVLLVQVGPVILNVQFSVVENLSPFNAILGHTWLHYMKAISSSYHQMVSFLTEDGHIDLYGNQLAARQCYQIVREARPNKDHEPLLEPANALDQ